ncbi:hypothetical protein V6N11_014323 [Hibiscus sabdariffa]|uniref:Uncharacterized protein n=2 Tax=Hibiscus sabdariffa TaxID=183260 RepID=A0ABR2B4P4_9ROSI
MGAICLVTLLLMFIVPLTVAEESSLSTYIVHLRKPEGVFAQAMDYDAWYKSFLPVTVSGQQTRMVHSYRNVVTGFSAKLTAEEAEAMKRKDGVISVRSEKPNDFPSTLLPLAYSGAKGNASSAFCAPGSLKDVDVKGKVVLCKRGGGIGRIDKGQEVKNNGGAAMILMNDELNGFSTIADPHVLPATHVSYEAGLSIQGEATIAEAELNYPSFSITLADSAGSQTYTRTLTNVGPASSTYTYQVIAPAGVDVSVSPEKIVFTAVNQKQTYSVTFSRQENASLMPFSQGLLKWVSGQHEVTSPIVAMLE